MQYETFINIFTAAKIIPVLVIDDQKDALMLTESILEGGLSTIEITLRTPEALTAIEHIRINFPEAIIGAGTITNPDSYKRAMCAGAQFVASPGCTEELMNFAQSYAAEIPFLPGAATSSEVQKLTNQNFELIKLFPISAIGEANLINSLTGPFPQSKFCPTGGLSLATAKSFLSHNAVPCVGGSWMAKKKWVNEKNWQKITNEVKNCVSLRRELFG